MPAKRKVKVVGDIEGVEASDDTTAALILQASSAAFVLGGTSIIKSIIFQEQEIRGTVILRSRPGVVAVVSDAEIARVRLLDKLYVVPRNAVDSVVVDHAEHVADGINSVGNANLCVPRPVRKREIVHAKVWTSARTAASKN